jgi:amino acid transporter/nucleotide-binding universal stress UspA family protein
MAEKVEVPEEGGVEPGEVQVTLRRDLGLLEVLMIGIGPNIGSTIFILIGSAVGIAGPAILLAFVLNLIVTLFTAMAYAELASAFPETGGGYLWVNEGLPKPMGFLGGWMSWVGHCIACAVYAIGFGWGVSALFSQYSVSFLGFDPEMVAKVFAAIIAAAFIYINYRGVKGAGRSEILISAFLIGIIVIYALFAVGYLLGGHVAPDAYSPFIPFGYMSIATSMAFTFMIFEGYEVVAQTGEEAKDPERTVPRAMFLCIAISCALFLVIAAVTLAVLGFNDIVTLSNAGLGQDALVVAARTINVPFLGGALISIGIIIGSIAAVNSVVFSASRVSFAMGRDGNLPLIFGKLHPKNQTPGAALLISGAIIILAAVVLPLNQVASMADILILLLFTLVNIAAITLRRHRPEVKRHFITPWFPYIPLAGIATKLFLAATLFFYEPYAWWLAFAVILIGLLLHYFAKGRVEIERIEAPKPVSLSAEQLRRYRVLIPVDDPKATALIELGSIIAQNNGGELLLMTVVEVPTAVPIDAVSKKVVEESKKMLEKLKRLAEVRGVPTRAVVSVSHEVVTAIIDTAKEEAANMIVLGWKGYTHTKKRILGRKIDEILRQTPCDVILLRAEEKLKPERILVLSGGLWHVSTATKIAAEIAIADSSRITILNAIINEKHMQKAREYAKRLTRIVEAEGVPVITQEIHPETIVGGVVAESMDYDLLVMGASAARSWERFAFGPIQDRIVKNAKCPVLIYKRVATPATPQHEQKQREEEEREEIEEEKEEKQLERVSDL